MYVKLLLEGVIVLLFFFWLKSFEGLNTLLRIMAIGPQYDAVLSQKPGDC